MNGLAVSGPASLPGADARGSQVSDSPQDPWVVSVVVPTRNSSMTLTACLESVIHQELQHGRVELIVVDGGSTDDSITIAERFADQVHRFTPTDQEGTFFTAPHQRNLGASTARGQYIYYVDADMILSKGLLAECVMLCEDKGAQAVIVFEQSFGSTFWARVKQVERDCYRGNDLVEAPRFVDAGVWRALGGLDTSIAGGGDDWDLHIRLRDAGMVIARAETTVLHDEGALTLGRLARKRFLYAKELLQFVGRHGLHTTARHYSPFSRGYARSMVRNRVAVRYAAGLMVMRSVEYGAGALGIIDGMAKRQFRG